MKVHELDVKIEKAAARLAQLMSNTNVVSNSTMHTLNVVDARIRGMVTMPYIPGDLEVGE